MSIEFRSRDQQVKVTASTSCPCEGSNTDSFGWGACWDIWSAAQEYFIETNYIPFVLNFTADTTDTNLIIS